MNASLAAARPQLGRLIRFKNVPVDPGAVRQGFFSPSELAIVMASLPPHLAHLVQFLAITGWRKAEGTGLLWSDIDFDDDALREHEDAPEIGPHACIRLGAQGDQGGR